MIQPREGITVREQDVPAMDNATLIEECARVLINTLSGYSRALGEELQRRMGNG